MMQPRSTFRFLLSTAAILFACSVWQLRACVADEPNTRVETNEAVFEVESNLSIGAAKVDVTPLDVDGMEPDGHLRIVHGVRDPIMAGVMLLDNQETKAAIVTIDISAAEEEMVVELRKLISEIAGVPEMHIMVNASHNHSGPGWNKHPEWQPHLLEQIRKATEAAAGDMRTVSVGYGEDEINFSINRRRNVNGKSIVSLNPEGVNDNRVKVLRFDDGREWSPYAVLTHAICHGCVFTWGDKASKPWPNGYPYMSADFSGVAQNFVEDVYGRTTVMFLQGCAGDIRPNLPGFPYRCGDEADIQWTGRNLGCATVRAADLAVVREQRAQRPDYYFLRCAHRNVELPGLTDPVQAELFAMKLGPYLLLSMPGEPMVEYGLNVEAAIADRAIPIVLGYTNGHLGYICTAESYAYGGYEPNSTPLSPEAEKVILAELDALADEVIGDVFESFAPKRAFEIREESER